jgi:restriction system protein
MVSININSKYLDDIIVGPLNAKWSAAGDRILRYYIDFRHKKLNLHKELSAPELFILQNKVDALMASWDEKSLGHHFKSVFQSGRDQADEARRKAEANLAALGRILAQTLSVHDAVNWDKLKDATPYNRPKAFHEPKPIFHPTYPPDYSDPKIGFLDIIFGRRSQIVQETEAAYSSAYAAWEESERLREQKHKKEIARWEANEEKFWQYHEGEERAYLERQADVNATVDQFKSAVERGDPEAVVEHATLVLEQSDYHGLFEKSFEVAYRPEDKLLLIEYELPNPDVLPSVRTVKFVKATGELRESHISDREKRGNFESVAYQICLRSIHELFEADEASNLSRVLFNGVIRHIDRGTGRETRPCILSIVVSRDDFATIDLSKVEPKICFKNLQGVSAAALAALAPIPPIIQFDKQDRRFVEAKEVASSLSSGSNIASMPWEDFEHLVRELFEKEFLSRGGEVRVTQSSRDEGVDAVAFDPDPISGGKIVIQAKRYTRTVGVSAVRDLYGTVMNEGASKGILVTTSDYGPDAHKFAAGKPLTLLNGGHLLHLLHRHGYSARISLAEARKELGLFGEDVTE